VKYIDLFAGLGGFHMALSRLGHECVFASEIDDDLRMLYERNFGMTCSGDIRKIDVRDIPAHDILCAGFPCQPFSKAGGQAGMDHPKLGDLYLYILEVVKAHKPSYIILENVPNLKNHGNGSSWQKIKDLLEEQGYFVDIEEISPHQYGIPQVRYRVYIVASLRSLEDFSAKFSDKRKMNKVDLKSILSHYPLDNMPVSLKVKQKIDAWQEFLDIVPKDEYIPLPLWAMEFGATYPFEHKAPSQMSVDELRKYKGSFGRTISSAKTKEEALNMLPPYARKPQVKFPDWKVKYIKNSRFFFAKHETILHEWAEKVEQFLPSFQKFEWNCHEKNPLNEDRKLSNYLIQLRPSGIRVKRPNTSPALVAMNMSQVPIIMWENRYMSISECKKLQSMEQLKYLPCSKSKAYSSLGNAVNVVVARMVARALVGKAISGNEVKTKFTIQKNTEILEMKLSSLEGDKYVC
jgi:DNA (cytosine-5)-methyltransferase 1